MDRMKILRDTLSHKEGNVLSYLKYMRELEDNDNPDLASLFADLAKAEEKHIAAIKSHLTHSTEDGLNG